MQDLEKQGAFYLGRLYDLAQRARGDEPLLYDAKDLTTHAVCVGMTGSGKTGLCLALLEEAALDGIPVIAIDPKGDVGNLLLTFPELRPADFRPWIEEAEADREGITPDQLAERTATMWREGLAQWDEDGERIRRFQAAADAAIYTPGSSAGLPISVLRSFDAPPAAILDDVDLLRDRIGAAASGLLTLVGIDADPIKSREHILLAQLFETAWRAGKDLDLTTLVRQIQAPPLERIGSVDLESFYPSKARGELAMQLNNLLASPSFAGWMEGEPLSIPGLLHTPEGKPRLSVLSIAHLSDEERMFFVTILLNELLAWVRTQSGTSNLRAILYMDEVFGYFPPTANPPSKKPMLTLLKQARAYGLGVVLATQNPVDLDYKGLSNAGTWFLGRLQTERDKARVLEGLEGASAAAGSTFDRGKMEATLAGLGKRVFLLNNVHEDRPVVFETRWCLSYLRGPLTRGQIQTLMADRKQPAEGSMMATTAQARPVSAAAANPTSGARPLVPPEVDEVFLVPSASSGKSATTVYRTGLLAKARLHFVDAKAKLDHWQELTALVEIEGAVPDDPWEQATLNTENATTTSSPVEGATFGSPPGEMLRAKSYAGWGKELAGYLYREYTLSLWSAPELKEYSQPGESEADFCQRIADVARRARDVEIADLEQSHQRELAKIDGAIARKEAQLSREKSQFWSRVLQTLMAAFSMVMQVSSSRKWTSQRNVSKTKAAARSAGRIAEDQATSGQLSEQIAQSREERAAKVAEHSAKSEEIRKQTPQVEAYKVSPRKSDIEVAKVALAWIP